MVRRPFTGILRTAPMVPVLVIAVIAFALLADGFTSPTNLYNILRDSSVLMVAATGTTLVFLIGGLDLSVGSVVAGSAVGAAIAMSTTRSVLFGVVVGVVIGIVIGVLNGLLIGYAKLVPFVLTLGMLLVVRAVAYLAAAVAAGAGGTAAAVGDLPESATLFGRGFIAAVPNLFVLAIVVVAVTAVLLAKTRYGRYVRLVGQNETAARFNGVNVPFIKLVTYTIAGLLSGIAGVMLSMRLGSGNPASGDDLLLRAITAAIIGGTALAGGHGGVVRTVFGALVIIALSSGLSLMGFQFWDQSIVLGIVILLGTQLTRRWTRGSRAAVRAI
ncbi:ABC transporter permease [Schumannella sp. 10F1B-5-1]|uniref:ABC transporter permease n=1 Tax=Schumannella sp. 10F1B-5-1 TaxID=2590780 RepID=UPI0011314F79|nr:ABC transporter permease [Schumannella sp. 10F1B-5-1]TPW72945.1 ABC transporter permease [Schumannella sp. 10F1B-5-1]